MTPQEDSIPEKAQAQVSSAPILNNKPRKQRPPRPISEITKKENLEWRSEYLRSISSGSEEIIRVCLRCNNPIPLSLFGKNGSVRYGFHYWCRKCASSIGKSYYHSVQKPKALSLNERIRKRSWYQRNIKMWEKRAKDKGVPFAMNASDLVDIATGLLPTHCRIFPHIKLDYDAGPDHRYWASLDRIAPELGYTSGNIWVISNAANMWKSNGSNPAERKRIVEIMTGFPSKAVNNQDQISLFDI